MRIRPVAASLIAPAVLVLAVAAQTDSWQIDPAHSAAQFAVRHLGISTVRGTFSKVSGRVQYSPSELSRTSIDVSIDANSIDTRVEKRDNDLRSSRFFDVAKFPTITFRSKKVESAGENKLKIVGDLAMHGVTKEIVLDVDGPTQAIKDSSGRLHMGASATANLNRRDFGINGAGATVADDVAITLDIELIQPASDTVIPSGAK